MNISKKIESYNIILLLTILPSIVLFLQFRYGNFEPIVFHDSPYPIDSISMIYRFSSVWRDNANFGYFDPTGIPISVFYIFISPFQILSNNNIMMAQFILLFILFDIILYSTYKLCTNLGIGKNLSIISAILYLANPYSIFYVWRILNTNIFFYAAVPLIVLSIFKIIENDYRYILFMLIGELLAFPTFTNLAWYISFIIIMSIISLSYNIILRHNGLKNIIICNILIFGIMVVPFIGYFLSIYITNPGYVISSSIDTSKMYYENNTGHVNPLSILSLTGLPPIYEKIEWYTFNDFYRSEILTVLIGIIVLSIVILSFKDANKKLYPFFILILLLGIVLFQKTGYFILKNFPVILLAFRDPFHKLGWGIALALSILIPLGIQSIKLRIKKPVIVILSTIAVFVVIVYWTLPFVLGLAIPRYVEYNNVIISAFTNLPDKYSQVIFYLKQDREIKNGDARVLVYPFTNVLWCEDKNKFLGNDVLRFSGISTVSTLSHVNSEDEIKFLLNILDINTIADPNYPNFISKLGIKYVLIRKNPCEPHLKRLGTNIYNIINGNDNFIRIIDNDDYSLFKLKNIDTTSLSIIFPKNFSESFDININNISGSTPETLNWKIEGKTRYKMILTPLENATSSTHIDINYLNLDDYSYYNFIKLVMVNSTPIKVWVHMTLKDGSKTGSLFPKNIQQLNGSTEFIFQMDKLEGIAPSNIERIFIGFDIEYPAPIIINNFEFFNDKFSSNDYLKTMNNRYRYNKISSTKYTVSIENLSEHFYMILSESYDKNWKVFVNDSKEIPDENHFIANGFANGWYVNNTRSHTFAIEYLSQRIYDIGIWTSIYIITIMLLISIVVFKKGFR